MVNGKIGKCNEGERLLAARLEKIFRLVRFPNTIILMERAFLRTRKNRRGIVRRFERCRHIDMPKLDRMVIEQDGAQMFIVRPCDDGEDVTDEQVFLRRINGSDPE